MYAYTFYNMRRGEAPRASTPSVPTTFCVVGLKHECAIMTQTGMIDDDSSRDWTIVYKGVTESTLPASRPLLPPSPSSSPSCSAANVALFEYRRYSARPKARCSCPLREPEVSSSASRFTHVAER
jgi:hypothetical protein